jgi:enediyne biosynthesis protein E4
MKKAWLFFATFLLIPAQISADDRCPIHLVDWSDRSGVTFVHTDGGSGRAYLVEFMVAGLALFDYDNDGLIDIYLLNGAPLRGTVVEQTPRNALYRNNGDGTFTDVTERAGVGDAGYGLGVAVADVNNNGFQDLYLNNFGPNVLYRNNGDGTFTDVTWQVGVDAGDLFGAGAAFLDRNGDGNLDLYVANYVNFCYDKDVSDMLRRYRFYAGPQDYQPVPDILFGNNGDGTFSDISQSSGIAAVAGAGMGMICFDFDNDGHTDIFVSNDKGANFLFHNDGTGRFREVGLAVGLAYDVSGSANGSMGADAGDFDNDGWLDLFMTDFQAEMPVLYRNLGRGVFQDVTRRADAGRSAFPHVNWGTGLVDFDNDGWRDIFIANGHLLPEIEQLDPRTSYRLPNTLLRNRGDGRFEDVSDRCGDGLAVVQCSKGAAFDDLDNNGRIDVVVLNANSRPTILRNQSSVDHRWLQIRLRGVTSNRDGVGAQVQVVADDLTQVAEVHSGRSYQSHYGTRLHFGLGHRDRVQRVTVRWVGGGIDTFTDLAVDQRLVLTQGTGQPSPEKERRE